MKAEIEQMIRSECIICDYTRVCECVCAMQGVMPLVQSLNNKGSGDLIWHAAHKSTEMRKPHSLVRPSKSNCMSWMLFPVNYVLNKTQPVDEIGDLPQWLLERFTGRFQKFVSIWLVVICCPEGEMKAGWLPRHRLHPDGSRQKGMDALYQQPMFHEPLKGSSTNKGKFWFAKVTPFFLFNALLLVWQ